jgi:hypothetical protein
LNEIVAKEEHKFNVKEGFGIVAQLSYYLLVSICILFTFVTFTMMALNDGLVTFDSMVFGEMWYEIAMLGGLAVLGGAYLWSKVEDRTKRPILALLVIAGFLMGASLMLATFSLAGGF